MKSTQNLETTVIGGDININSISPDNSERAFGEVMFSSYFDQHITVPARVTENTATLIYHIWSYSFAGKVSAVFDAGFSDHLITFAFIPFRILTKTIKYNFRDHSDQCIDDLEKSFIDNVILPEHLTHDWSNGEYVIGKCHCFSQIL